MHEWEGEKKIRSVLRRGKKRQGLYKLQEKEEGRSSVTDPSGIGAQGWAALAGQSGTSQTRCLPGLPSIAPLCHDSIMLPA